jgi:hypothetical protein
MSTLNPRRPGRTGVSGLGQAAAPGSRQGILSVILAFQAILIAVVGGFSIHWLFSASVPNKNSPDPRALLALVLFLVVPVVVTGLAVAGLILGIMGRRAALRRRDRVPVAVTLGMFLNLLTLLHPLWLCAFWGWRFIR